jgi:hypothetical protein
MADTRADTLDMEAELLRLRNGPFPPERAEMARTLIDGLIEMYRKYGILPDSTPGIREERDRRG